MTTLATNKAVTVDPTTTRTGTLRAATVDPIAVPTETPRAVMGNRMIPMEATEEAMADPTTNRMKTPRAVMDNQVTHMGVIEVFVVNPTTARTETPRAVTDDRTTTRTAANKVPTADLTTDRTKTPRAATDDRTTPTGEIAAVMANRTTTAMVNRKPPTEAAPPVTSDQMITLMEASKEAMANPTITLVLMADRRSAAVVRGCDRGVRNTC